MSQTDPANNLSFRANEDIDSRSVSNQMYGALILEPTIPSKAKSDLYEDINTASNTVVPTACTKNKKVTYVNEDGGASSTSDPFVPSVRSAESIFLIDADDFWFNIAQTQTLKRTNETPNYTQHRSDSFSIERSNDLHTYANQEVHKSGKGTVLHTEQCSLNSDMLLIDFGTSDSTSRETEWKNFGSNDEQRKDSKEPKQNPDNLYEDIFSVPTYELAKPIPELSTNSNQTLETLNNKDTGNSDQLIVKPKKLLRRYRTVGLTNGKEKLSTKNEFKTHSLDRKDRNLMINSNLQEGALYESVDNLAYREQMPIPNSPAHNQGWATFDDPSPLYAKVEKRPKKHTGKNPQEYCPPWTPIPVLCLDNHSHNDRPISGIGMEYPYAMVDKPKRYENWPPTSSIRHRMKTGRDVPNNESNLNPISDLIYSEVTINNINGDSLSGGATANLEYAQVENLSNNETNDLNVYSSIDDFILERSRIYRSVQDRNENTELSSEIPQPRITTNRQESLYRERSMFNPCSFIFYFNIPSTDLDRTAVVKVLPKGEGKCWIMCQKDLKIRLFDSQGFEEESIYIGLEGQSMTYDGQQFLFVTCKSTKRIFRIDVKNLQKITPFVDCENTPTEVAYDVPDNSVIVCQPSEHVTRNCILKFTPNNSPSRKAFRPEEGFSKPSKIFKNINGDIIVSDVKTNSITFLEQDGGVKSRFTGNDVFTLSRDHSFTCDLKGNVIILSNNSNRNLNNCCLLDENGTFIDSFSITEVVGKSVYDIAMTDISFIWIACEDGIYIYDYQIV